MDNIFWVISVEETTAHCEAEKKVHEHFINQNQMPMQ